MGPIDATRELQLAYAAYRAGDLTGANDRCSALLLHYPDQPEALHLSGIIALSQHRSVIAEALIRQSLAARPDSAEANVSLGVALQQQGRLDEAAAAFRSATRLSGDMLEAHLYLGEVMVQQGRLDEARDAFEQAARVNPNSAGAFKGLGITRLRQGLLSDSVTALRRAAQVKPDAAEVHIHLGEALRRLGRLDEAMAVYSTLVSLLPRSPGPHNNLGLILQQLGRMDEAVEEFRQALSKKPDSVVALVNLATALTFQSRHDEAMVHFRRAVEIDPASRRAMVDALHGHPGYDGHAIGAEARLWAAHASRQVPASGAHPNDRDPHRRLRIGYVSPYFHFKPDAHFMVPLLANHDHAQFEVFAFADQLHVDSFTPRFQQFFDHWCNLDGLDDTRAADLMAFHRIDILVNVSIHDDGSRLLALARRPAPIQIHWLAFASATTGLSQVDWRISDALVDPPDHDDSCYTERTVRLPRTAWCYDPLSEPIPVVPPPSRESGRITFGNFGRLSKINDQVLDLWGRVLRAVPGSRILLLSRPGSHCERIRQRLAESGCDARAVDFIEPVARDSYLRRYGHIDMILDTFPFSGHTTSCDALWMGVPVVTLAHRPPTGRVTAAMLLSLGLAEFVAATPDEYVAIATQWADANRLTELRRDLRQRLEASALMDAVGFARDTESLYRQLWMQWCHARR